MQIKVPCTLVISIDDSAMAEVAALLPGRQRDAKTGGRGAHLAGLNAARAAARRDSIDFAKESMLAFFASGPPVLPSVLHSKRGDIPRAIAYAAARELLDEGKLAYNANRELYLVQPEASAVEPAPADRNVRP